MRSCPRCTYPLSMYRHAKAEVDHCHRCGGVFLDRGEADEILGPSASPERFVEMFAAKRLGPRGLICPKDATTMSVYRLAFEGTRVEVDVCERCLGVWLDRGESPILKTITESAGTYAEGRRDASIKPGFGMWIFQFVTGFPVEAWHPVRRAPVLVPLLLSVIGLVFAGQVVLQVLEPAAMDKNVAQYVFVATAASRGEALWTLVTYAFFHGGVAHLIGNAYFLWVFGDNVEDELGGSKLLRLYLVSALAGGLAYWAVNPTSSIPMLGASGAIAGVMGAYAVLFPRAKLWVMVVVFRFAIPSAWFFAFWVVYQFVMKGFGVQGTAWMTHAGGVVAGAVLALWYRRAIDHDHAQVV